MKTEKILKYIKRKATQLLCRLKTGSLIRNYTVMEELDIWFTDQMDKGEKPKLINDYIAEFAGKLIWIENKYYASPMIYNGTEKLRCLPYMDTTCRFFELVEEERKRNIILLIRKLGDIKRGYT